MGCPRFVEDSEMYQRLTKWPMVVSFGIAATLWLCYVNICLLWLSGFWGGFLFALSLKWSIAIAAAIRVYFAHYLGRQRIWRWLNTKFSSWEDLRAWLMLTSGSKLEELVQVPIDSWEPDSKNGGTK